MLPERSTAAGSPLDARARRFELCGRCAERCEREGLTSVAGARLCAACAARASVVDAARQRAPYADEPEGVLARLVADMRLWCEGAAWLPRAPLLALCAWWAVRHVNDAEHASVIDGLNFGIHELGHVVFSPFGLFLSVAGGTLMQCLAPVAGGVMFLRQRDYFAVAVAFGWFATNLYDVAVYVADARSQALPLVGLGSGEPLHDWGYLLSTLGLLDLDQALATALRVGGALSFAASLGLGGWLLARMILAGRS